MPTLAGRVALVTGASRGIGAAIARRLAVDGAAVAVNYRQGRREAEAVVAGIEAAGGRAAPFEADLREARAIRRLFEEVEARLGLVDLLVNNAGAVRPTPMGTAEAADVDLLLAVNLRAPLLTSSEFVRRRGERRGGRIVHIGSGAARHAFARHAAYAATKAALEGMTRTMAAELGPRGITVNTVAPGATDTGLLTPELEAALVPATALGRVGRPEDVAEVVAFVLSEAGGWITGQVIPANGGLDL